jgi:hypothetical protein
MSASVLSLRALRLGVSALAAFGSACSSQRGPRYAQVPATAAPAGSLTPIPKEQIFQWTSPNQSACPDTDNISGHRASSTTSSTTRHRPPSEVEFPNETSPDPPQSAPGAVSTSDAALVVASMRPGFRACYQRFPPPDPRAFTAVRLTLRLDCLGAVRSILAEARGLEWKTVDCVVGRAAASFFPPPAGGSAQIQIPVTFVRQDAKHTR